jgi:hypothetical protein
MQLTAREEPVGATRLHSEAVAVARNLITLTPWLPAFPKERSTFARHNGEVAAEFSTRNCCLVDNPAALEADQAQWLRSRLR